MNTHKISLFRSGFIALFAALFTIGSATAARINVFEQNLGSLPNTGWTTEVNTRANALLNDNDIDFGYFVGVKSINYFKHTSDKYTSLKKDIGNGVPGRVYFTYLTDRYEIVALTDTEDCDTTTATSAAFGAYLLRDKESLREYLCVHGRRHDVQHFYLR